MGTAINIIIACIGVSAVALLIKSKIKQARGHGGCRGNCVGCSGCSLTKK